MIAEIINIAMNIIFGAFLIVLMLLPIVALFAKVIYAIVTDIINGEFFDG